MPLKDKKGPLGEGPLTGRGQGPCEGDRSKINDVEFGRGLGQGPGRNQGRGFNRGFGGRGFGGGRFGRGFGRGFGRCRGPWSWFGARSEKQNLKEYKQELEKVKDESFNAGIEAGIKKAFEDEEKNKANGLAQFSASVTTLENSAKEFRDALESIKKELVLAAIDISQEVINLELSQNSQEVAKVLGDELIKELQSASKITLRVNPKDHGAISEHVGVLENIQIVSDSAVNEGGVIAISDAGNIDSQISKRFQRVKKVALSE